MSDDKPGNETPGPEEPTPADETTAGPESAGPEAGAAKRSEEKTGDGAAARDPKAAEEPGDGDRAGGASDDSVSEDTSGEPGDDPAPAAERPAQDGPAAAESSKPGARENEASEKADEEAPIVDALNREEVPDSGEAPEARGEGAGRKDGSAPEEKSEASGKTPGEAAAPEATEAAASKGEKSAKAPGAATPAVDGATVGAAGAGAKAAEKTETEKTSEAAKAETGKAKAETVDAAKTVAAAKAPVAAKAATKPPRVKKPKPGRKEQREAKSRRGRIAARSVTASLAVLLVGAFTVGAQVYLPASPAGTARDAVTAQVPAADLVTSCAGPAGLSSGITPGTDAAFTPDSSSAQHWFDVVSAPYEIDGGGSSQASAFGIGALGKDALGASVLTKPAGTAGKAVVARKQPLSAGLSVEGKVAGGEPAQVQTVQTSLSTDGDLRGLATEACGQIGADFWLVGGSTEVGRSTRLVLSNPTQTAANVAIDVFGAKGRIETPTAEDLLVPPGTTRSVLMEGLAPDQAQLAVHVSARGGLISAAMQQNVLRGLQPGGVDFISPAAKPSTNQFVPGIALATEAPADKNYADAAPVLRLASAGGTDTTATIKLYGPDGAADLGDKGQVTIPAHGVVDVSLAAVGEGIFTADVTADDPIVAAARVIRQGPTPDGVPVGGPADFAWSPAVPALNGSQLAVLPSDVTSNLDFSARGGDGSVIVRGVGADGTLSEPRTVAVPASTTVALDPTSLMPGVSAVLFSTQPGTAKIVAATVATVGDEAGEMISIVPIPPAPPGAESLTLRLR